jgi:hypothetical protein
LGAGEDGLGVGLVLDGLGVGVFVGLGVGVGVPVGGVVAWLAVGCGLGDDVLVSVLVGLAVGLADWLVLGATLAGPEGEALGVTLTDEEDDVRPVGVALPETLPELLGEAAGIIAESTRIAAFGRLAQAPFAMGGGKLGRTTAPKTLELNARSMKPESAVSATGLTSRAFTGPASSWTSPVGNWPPSSSQYACQD